MKPHRGFILDKLPWPPGFVGNISGGGIVTPVMDDTTATVQRCPAGGSERGQRWIVALHMLGQRGTTPAVTSLIWGRGSSPKNLRPNGTKWGRKFISCAYVLGLICLYWWSGICYHHILQQIYSHTQGRQREVVFFPPSIPHSQCSLVSFHLTACRMFNWCAIVLC